MVAISSGVSMGEQPGSFKLLHRKEITVPDDYNPKTWLDKFRGKYPERLFSFGDGIYPDPYPLFPGPSYMLKQGECLRVSTYESSEGTGIVSYGKRMAFLDQQGSVYPGLHGLLLAWTCMHEMMRGMWYPALDRIQHLRRSNSNDLMVPLLQCFLTGLTHVEMCEAEHGWDGRTGLVCFNPV